MFNEKLQVDFLFSDAIAALHVMDVFSMYSPVPPARPKNPQEVWGAISNLRIGIFGPPKCIQMDEGKGRKDEVWTDYCSGRRIKLLLQGVGAHP